MIPSTTLEVFTFPDTTLLALSVFAGRAAPDGNRLGTVDSMLAGSGPPGGGEGGAAGHRCLYFPVLLPAVEFGLFSLHFIIGGASLNPGHLRCP